MKTKLLILCLPFFIGCDAFKMEYVPSAEQIQKNYSFLLVEPTAIQGIFSNKDVDSAIFSYKTKLSSAKEATDRILLEGKWEISAKTQGEIIASRSKPQGKGELNFYSFERVKISFGDEQICVGYLQIDTTHAANRETETAETRWAAKNLWPKYEACKNTLN